jgi:hypothetical protein
MDILLDETTGDISLTGSDMLLTSGQEAIEQHLRQRLQTFFGEWFLDSRIGIPYFQQILKKNPNFTVVDSLLKKEIIETSGVEELIKFELNLDNPVRELIVEFEARTIEGDVITFSQEIL